jgi:AcrR family transcriptional regulator
MNNSARSPEQDQRARLLTAALQTVEDSGPEALRARALTAQVGASTQALYTHFGGMPGLLEALVADGFSRFAHYVAQVPESEDPVADFYAKGRAYGAWALVHPRLYQLMFGLSGDELRRHAGLEIAVTGPVANSPEAQSAVNVLVRSMTRVEQSGRIDPVDPVVAAGQFLSATHGYLLLEIAGVFGPEGDGLGIIRLLAINLMVGLGDSRAAATESLRTVEASDAPLLGLS